PAPSSSDVPTPSAETVSPATDDTSLLLAPSITFGIVEQVGFKNVTLQRVPFSGILFERIDLRDFRSVPVIQQNVLQYNRDRAASFYELHADSKLLANEIYLLIKEKTGAAPGIGVNETNEFRDGSFYINYSDVPDSAFLVVRAEESVYALTYRKELHAFISSLLPLL
ncbi:MAG TPA: hypothetical protein VI588_02100, partial [Candidatus Gracilibacteria bacterium]|nr:hypothetical protein [Candidatus Gracilibacteria bacterium]